MQTQQRSCFTRRIRAQRHAFHSRFFVSAFYAARWHDNATQVRVHVAYLRRTPRVAQKSFAGGTHPSIASIVPRPRYARETRSPLGPAVLDPHLEALPLEGYRFKALVQQARRASQESAKMRSAYLRGPSSFVLGSLVRPWSLVLGPPLVQASGDEGAGRAPRSLSSEWQSR